MPVYALWHGGANYAHPELTDAEIFPSIRAAGAALLSRAETGHWLPQPFTYADGRELRTLTPGADCEPSMALYSTDPATTDDPYPFRLLTIGARGGVNHQTT